MIDGYIEKVKSQMEDVPEEYNQLLEVNYADFLEEKYEQGYSQAEVMANLDKPKNIAKKYSTFYKAQQVYGTKHLKQARKIAKSAISLGMIKRKDYLWPKIKLILLAALIGFIGTFLVVLGILFFFGNLKGLPMVLLGLFFFFSGIGCYSYIPTIFRNRKMLNRMLKDVTQRTDLKSFEK